MTRQKYKFLTESTTQAFVNHMLIIGKSGSGKSNAGECIITDMVGDWKVIDLYDSGRFENMLYGIPEDDPFLVQKLHNLTLRKPATVPNDKILMVGPEITTNFKFPKDVNVCSLNDEDLRIEDLFYLLGDSDSVKGTLATIENKLGNLTFSQLLDFCNRETNPEGIHAGTFNAIKRQLNRWHRSGMFSTQFDRIDLHKICMNKDKLSSFSTFLCEPEQEPVIYGVLLKKIFDMKRRNQIPHRIVIYLREMSNFMTPEFSFCRKIILRIIREGRDIGVDIIADQQRFKDCPPVLRRQFGYIVQMKADFEDAQVLSTVQEVPMQYLKKVPHFGVGEAIVATGMEFNYPILFAPSAHYHKKPGMQVMDMLAENAGGWHEFENKLGVEKVDRYKIETTKTLGGSASL